MNQDPFSILGVSPDASEDEIKSAYRRLAKKYHPDLNPGDKRAEAKMREVNDAYTEALRIRRGGGFRQGAYGRGASAYERGGFGSYQNPFSGSDRQGNPFEEYSQQSSPFGGFDFDPFFSMFGSARRASTAFRPRQYSNPELKTAEDHILASRFQDAIELLNRIPVHEADWHALYARANYGLGNRISALDHARKAVQMSPGDQEYQELLQVVESGKQGYQRTRNAGYDFQSAVCSNPCLTCCAMNALLNCCLGGFGRYGFCC